MLKPRTSLLLLATLAAGIGTGFFLTYAYTIMPGLGTTDDRTFVGAFQGLERTFGSFETTVNWPVMVAFFGAPLLAAAAVVVHRRDRRLATLAGVALVLLLSVIATTFAFNVPSNDAISAAGDPATIDVARVRAEFDEAGWRAWNLVRAAAAGIAFLCLASALHLADRRTAPVGERAALPAG